MGMFDQLRCKYPLPLPQYQDYDFQTKDTPEQWMDNYEIREDGTLWHEAYDIEDQSDPSAEGRKRVIGMMTRVNERWEQLKDFTGEIRFYTFAGKERRVGWIEFSAYFVDGKLNQINTVRHDQPILEGVGK